MVLRSLFTLWFSLTSALAPGLCCCTPMGAPAAHADSRSVAAPRIPSDSGCPYCKETRSQSSPTGDRFPAEPSRRCPGQCPCKNHLLASALPDSGQDLRVLVQSNWLPDVLAFPLVNLPYAPLAEVNAAASNHTGPPPLWGVELLHRIHVLIC